MTLPTSPAAATPVATAVSAVVTGATEAISKKGGPWHMIGHFLEEVLEVGAGATAAYAGSRVAKQQELKRARQRSDELHAEGKHDEATGLMAAALSKFTMSDEAAEFKVFPRVVDHFNRINEAKKADQLLETFCGLDETGLNRLGEILLLSGDADAQFLVLVQWGKATKNQQAKMLQVSRVALPEQQQPGYVFATELRGFATTQRDKSNANVAAIKARIRAGRASRSTVRP